MRTRSSRKSDAVRHTSGRGTMVLYIMTILLAGFGFLPAGSLFSASVGSGKASEAWVKVSTDHMFLSKQIGDLEVVEIVEFSNPGEAAYVGGVRVSLPNGYRDLAFRKGLTAEAVTVDDEGFVYTGPIDPGSKAISFSYKLAIDRLGVIAITKRNAYPVARLDILTRDMDINVKGKGLSPGEDVSLGEETYRHFYISDLPGDSEVKLEITTVATVAPAAGNRNGTGNGDGIQEEEPSLMSRPFIENHSNVWIWRRVRSNAPGAVWPIKILGLVIFVFLVWASAKAGISRRKPRRPAAETLKELEASKEALLDRIAILDKKLTSRQISEDEHKELRERWKGELVKIYRKIREIEEMAGPVETKDISDAEGGGSDGP